MRFWLYSLLSFFLLGHDVFPQSQSIEADSLSSRERKKHKSVMNASKEGNSYKLRYHLGFMNAASAARVVSARSEGTTPLNEAAKGRHINTITVLLSYGADVNVPDEFENRTPLIISTIAGGSEINTLLIQKGASVNHKDVYQRSALYYAIKYDYVGIVMELIKKGARVNDKDIEGVSPLELARKSEFRRIRSLVNSARTKSLPSENKSDKALTSEEKEKKEEALERLKTSNKVEDDLREVISPSKFKVGKVDYIKTLIVKENASVKISNNFDNSLLLQLAFLMRNLKRDREGVFDSNKEKLFELLEIVLERGGDPDRKNKRGYSARKVFDEWRGEEREALRKIISPKKEEKTENKIAKESKSNEVKSDDGINEKEWKDKCIREAKGKQGSKNVCEDDWVTFSNCIKEEKKENKKFILAAAQKKCEQKAEETVSVEEVPELEIEKDSWFNKCLKRFEEKTDKLTEDQIKEGNKWCNRMFEEFEHCVSESPNNANSVELNINKCQDKIYAKEKRKFPEKKPRKEKEVSANVEEMIQWLGDDNIEKTDLKKGDYIEIDLNSSFQYGRQVGWRTGWALEFKDIDKDCKPLNLRVKGLKIFGRVPDKFDKCEASIYAYSIKKPKKIQSKVRRVLLTSEKKNLPTIELEIKDINKNKVLQEISLLNLKPGESLNTLSFKVKKAKWKRLKFELQPNLKELDKCYGLGQNGAWIFLSKSKGESLIDYRGGPTGYIKFGKVPKTFQSCMFSIKMTNIAGEFSESFTVKLACPTCLKEFKLGKLIDKRKGKIKAVSNLMNTLNKSKSKDQKASSSPLNKDLKKYIDHTNWNPKKIKELVSKGASPNLKNRFGNTVLSMAVIKGKTKDYKDLIKFLIESGGDPTVENSKGWSAQKFADRYQNKSIKKLIEETLKDPIVKIKRSLLGQWEDCYRNMKLLSVWSILPNSNLTVKYFSINLKPGSKNCEGAKRGVEKFKMSEGSFKVIIPEAKDRVKDKEAYYLDFDLKNSPQGPLKYFNLVKMGEEGLIFSLDNRGGFPTNKDYRLREIYKRNRRVWTREK